MASQPPSLNIPQSHNAVRVFVIDNLARLDLTSSAFHSPTYKGAERYKGPSFSFLIEHSSGETILFDLGIRHDWRNMVPSIVEIIDNHGWTLHTQNDTAGLLQEHGIDVDNGAITSVVWSHPHFDHIGDITKFPKSTKLVVGQDFKKTFLPGYPDNPKSHIYQHDFEGREVQEVDFSSTKLQIGRFEAYDFFGDGSFYLLNTPGHTVAHTCGLARTSTSPDTFVLMGGDASHHCGEFRPSEHLPLPEHITPSPIPEIMSPGCPGDLFLSIHPENRRDKPFYSLTAPFNHDLDLANWSIAGLQEFDCVENVLVLIAHDAFVTDQIPLFPKPMNAWFSSGWKDLVRWKFLGTYREEVCGSN